MNNFKVGDRLLCVRPTGYEDFLIIGNVYTCNMVNAYYNPRVDGQSTFFLKNRFILATPLLEALA
jgi:hypothetical protein